MQKRRTVFVFGSHDMCKRQSKASVLQTCAASAQEPGICRSLAESKGSGLSGRVFARSSASAEWTTARWWELTLLPMTAYMCWAVAYYVKA